MHTAKAPPSPRKWMQTQNQMPRAESYPAYPDTAQGRTIHRSNGKQRLCYLPSATMNRRKWVFPCFNTNPHMRKQFRTDQCRQTSHAKTAEKIRWLPRCHIQHDHISQKKNQCRTKICGQYKDSHMNCSCNGRDAYLSKIRRLIQHAGHKEYKNNLYKFRRLQCHTCHSKRQMCTAAHFSHHKHNP